MKRLWNTFRYTMIRLRGQTLGWGISLALFGMLLLSMYDTIAAQQDQFQEMIANYPKEFLAFFGGDVNSMLTPAGFLGMYGFSMLPLIVGIFAILAGSGLIAADEERGRLDLIMAHPVGRTGFFYGRILGLFMTTLIIHILGWLGFSLLLSRSSIGIGWGQMAVPFLSLFVQSVLFASLALLLSLILPSRNLAATLSGGVLVASYFISSLGFLSEGLETAAEFLPYHYYQTVLSLSELNLVWLFSLFGISLIMIAAAWLRFTQKDIRLTGEGTWRIPLISKKRSMREVES